MFTLASISSSNKFLFQTKRGSAWIKWKKIVSTVIPYREIGKSINWEKNYNGYDSLSGQKKIERDCNENDMSCYENFCSISHGQSSHQNAMAYQNNKNSKTCT